MIALIFSVTGDNELTIDIGDNMLQVFMAIVMIVNTYITLKRTKELKPNGGSSIHDKVDKLYRVVAADDRANDTQPHERNSNGSSQDSKEAGGEEDRRRTEVIG